jgi:predicted amidohydrolase YtcJ
MSDLTVYRAKKIITMDPLQPEATHVAVRDGHIVAVGDWARMQAWGATKVDERFADQVLMPGLIEGHSHALEGGMWQWPYLGWFDRRDVDGHVWPGLRSMAAVIERLQAVDAEMSARGDDSALFAWGFDPIYFGAERMDTTHLDRVSTTRRVVVGHANGHLMNANSVALRDAGIDRDCEIEGVMRYPNGEPNGELQEPAAMFPVMRLLGNVGVLAPVTTDTLRGFGRIARRVGVTTATDLVNKLTEHDIATLREATDDEDFPVRLLPAFQAFHGPLGAVDGAAHVAALKEQSSERLRFGLVKMMLDGSIQGFSARLRAPGYFNGAPNGIWVTAPSQYEHDFEVYHRAGLDIHTHTNGDEASDAAVNAIAQVLSRAPRPDHRHTLQHGQMIDHALFARMASLGIAANLFTNHLWYWGDQHLQQTMGPDRAHRLDDCRSALNAGVHLSVHSDAPITPLGPLHVAWCAVNRVTPSGVVLGEGLKLSVMEALHAITLGAAWTLRLEHEVGSIEVGKRADFAVLDDDPLALPPEQLKDVRVWGTVLCGRVHAAD